jgi:hypothetical protein
VVDGVLCPADDATVDRPERDGDVFLVTGAVCVAPDASCGCEPALTRPGEFLSPE